MTALDRRMALHVEGQVTWPEPEVGRMCDACAHYSTARFKTAGKGECRLVRLHQNVLGRGFDGAKATACPKFVERVEG